MAGNAKPNIENLGPEGKITFLSYNDQNRFDKIDSLLDGNILHHNLYGVLMYDGSPEIIFEIHQKSNIYAYGTKYSDGGGNTPTPVKLYKYNGSGFEYIKTIQTKDDEWYLLVSNLEKGVYKLYVTERYTKFTEWYIERDTSNMYIINKTNSKYSIKPEFYLNGQFNELGYSIDITKQESDKYMEDNIKNYVKEIAILDETFRPIDKFDRFNLVIKRK